MSFKPNMPAEEFVAQQQEALRLKRSGHTLRQIADALNITKDAAWRRVKSAEKRERLDPALAETLESKGIVDLAGLHSGWLLEKDKQGSGHSLYFYLGPDQEKVSFADAIVEVLSDIPRLAPISLVPRLGTYTDCATWLALADLHVGGDYSDPILEENFVACVDDIVSRLPPARHAVLIELGDLLEANDHKGVTPHSGNPLSVRREDHLYNTKIAVRLIRHALIRLLETHETVEAHFIKGNHDPTAYFAVMLALEAHFQDNPRIRIVVSDDEFRVIPWGQCAAFPHHGDTLKWNDLQNVFASQFPDEWAQAKMHRHVMTAHFHHDRKADTGGAVCEHFRTIHRPNAWARSKGLFSRGSLTAMTVHKDRGEISRTSSNLRDPDLSKGH